MSAELDQLPWVAHMSGLTKLYSVRVDVCITVSDDLHFCGLNEMVEILAKHAIRGYPSKYPPPLGFGDSG